MNLAALQQRDPYISEIVDTASQVALYSFNCKTNGWEKTSIEGSLFIYKRSATPLHGFMILNRLGLNNLIEPIAKDLEFQLQDPFLLYRNAKTRSIYGIWFYDKDECRKLGELMNSYLQAILEEHGAKSQGQRPGSGGDVAQGNRVKPKMPALQVDIMQMLSKAQQEYDTTRVTGDEPRKTEPKPMIDNPNAAATKANNIIRPMPLKMPDSEQRMTGHEDAGGGTTPSTAPISLDALFRTASLQQQETTNIPNPSALNKPPPVQRSVSLAASTSSKVTEQTQQQTQQQKIHTESDEYPPLLKHIMSTGSMVSDIEKQQIQSDVFPPANHPSAIDTVLPDLTQPPPTHPAYRGPPPTIPKPITTDNAPKGPATEIVPFTGKGLPPQMITGNLTTQSSSSQYNSKSVRTKTKSLSSEHQLGSRISPSGDADSRRISPHRTADSRSDSINKVPSPVSTKSSSLLTPAELLQSSGGATGFTTLMDKPQNPNLASAAASLSTELLSPMAFVSSATRKTPPVAVAQEKSEVKAKDSDSLPVAALTKEQLQQAMLYLIKNDPSFISTLHEAYLKSLQELSSGQKS